MEQRSTKNYFQFNGGLNTESSEINFPDGFSTDERNYELLIDGSRKRRKGLQQESGGSTLTVSAISAGDAYTSFKWRDVAGDATRDFIVHQMGARLYFTNDAETISTSLRSDSIQLAEMLVDNTRTEAEVADFPCQFAQGRGVLLVTHKYLKPFYLNYDADSDTIYVNIVTINHRDFYGIDDGVGNQIRPPQATFQDYTDLNADHLYNLRNRGWSYKEITSFADRNDPSSGDYPSKAMLWWTGYDRTVDTTASTATRQIGTRTAFDADKVLAELVSLGSAPQGALLLDPLDTRYTASTSNDYGDDPEVQIVDIIEQSTSGSWPNITITALITTGAAHGRSVDDVITISGNQYLTTINFVGSLDGSHVVKTVPSSTTFTIEYESSLLGAIAIVDGEKNGRKATPGQVNGNPALANSDGSQLTVGPTACAYYAGRAWWAGIESPEYGDTIFFSQISQKPTTFGACHQDNDPTDPEEAGLVESDGGFIVIPNLGTVHRMLPMRDSLIVFSDQGVWEISGANRRIFTPGNYNVRKITESECSSPRSPIVIGNTAIYTGSRGIHQISPNQYTSVLEEESISDALIQTLWNNIPIAEQALIQTCYDEALKRVYFLYDDGTATTSHIYQFALILDMRVGAYYKYQFNEGSDQGVAALFSITDADSSNSNKKVKFVVQQSTTTVDICDLNQTDYLDFDGAESPLPYVLSGWDNVGDFQRRKQAPVVTVYAKRTETGYTAGATGYTGDNESSNLLTAYWDWTDDSVSGKIGSQNETYRHTRGFVPTGPSDVDGYPVVVTRNKIRGRGRTLQLRFDGASGKDSHILGFTINYKVTRKV